MGAAWRAGMPRRRVIVQNEPNFEVSSFQFEVSRVGPEGAHAKALWLQTAHFTLQTPCPTPRWAGLRAKRTQFARPGPGSLKSEARNPKQIQMANDTNAGKRGEMREFETFEFRSLELVSDFEIRASNLAPGGGGGCRSKLRKTKPNLGQLGYLGKGYRMGRGPAGE
jgi:hypothetical protein